MPWRTSSARGSDPGPARVVLTADDFGLAVPVNEAVERAHRDGVLGCASLMVGAAAAADAIERAGSTENEAIIEALNASTWDNHGMPYGPTVIENGQVTDTTRIEKIVPTIEHILAKGGAQPGDGHQSTRRCRHPARGGESA